jgi:hypothetical protein
VQHVLAPRTAAIALSSHRLQSSGLREHVPQRLASTDRMVAIGAWRGSWRITPLHRQRVQHDHGPMRRRFVHSDRRNGDRRYLSVGHGQLTPAFAR